MRKRLVAAAAAGLLVLGVGTPAWAADPAEGTVLGTADPEAIAGSYIVVLKDGAGEVGATARALAEEQGGSVVRTYQHALKGFEASLNAAGARRLAADPEVASVTQNHVVTASEVPSWGLDRIDQRSLPLDGSYRGATENTRVTAYVIDGGVNLTHSEFGNRIRSGWDFSDGDADASDCKGHGTHVAGTIGGETYGVAKNVEIVAVRVLNCDGAGTAATVIAGIDWVTADHLAGTPAVANMSLSGTRYSVEEQAVSRSIADGVTYVVAAGNDDGADACDYTPGSVPEAITVGASGPDDARAGFSNIGSCVDVFAPGVDIVSAYIGDDTATHTASGTSMAAPHVAGAAALVLAEHPTWSPAQVSAELIARATPDVVTDAGEGSPNRLLYVDASAPADDYSLTAASTSAEVVAGGSTSVAINAGKTAGAAQQVQLSARGLPSAGATATFSPASITSDGGSSELTIATTTKTAPGTYDVLVVGDGQSATRTTRIELTVTAAAGCVGAADTDVTIAGNTIPVTIAGCDGNAAADSTLELHLDHTYVGDLTAKLVAPSGALYNLIERTGADSDDVDYTFTLDLSAESAEGVWSLSLLDNGPSGTGTFDSFVLNLGGEQLAAPVCGGVNPADYTIVDRGSVESPISVTGCDRAAGQQAYVEVRVVHPYERDLILYLIAPDGSRTLLQQLRASGVANVFRTYIVTGLAGKSADGEWTLRVEDQLNGHAAGTLDNWKLTL